MNIRATRRKYGQNYLIDKAVLFEMGNTINSKSNDSFIEIGPGLGALTEQINKESIKILAIDVDEQNIDYLKTQIGNPEGLEKPNKKFYDPRVWLRKSEENFVKRLVKSFEDLNNINTL